MKKIWRLVDTGHLSAAENMAWDQALLTAQDEGEPGPVFRFLQFDPACVLVGRHQSPHQEARIDYVLKQGWHINRRITGGGAIFFDPSQIGWEIFATRDERWSRTSHSQLYRRISAGFIAGMEKLGVRAQYRPRNDIEVGGRKLSGTGGTSEGRAFMFQGTLLVKNVAQDMLYALRVPAEKLGRHGLESIKERVVFLEELINLPPTDEIKRAIIAGFEEVFGVEIVPGEPTPRERELFEHYLEYMRSDEWIYRVDRPAEEKGTLVGISRRKGVVRCAVSVDAARKRVSAVQFWGDFFINPPRFVNDLEAYLKHRRADPKTLSELVHEFWSAHKPDTIGVSVRNFADALARAVAKIPLIQQGFTFDEANRLYFVNVHPAEWMDYPFSHFLFPYCSKLVGCRFRHKHDCPVCGLCTVGDGYVLAKEANLESYTVTSFENLRYMHKKLRKLGSPGYIGSCCEEFFVKHYEAFRRSGLGIVLIRVDSTTCYELSQQKAAYRGEFESQTELDINLIKKVLGMWRGARKEAKV